MKLLVVVTVICVFSQLASAGVTVNLHQDIESGLVSCKDTAAPGELKVQEEIHEVGHVFSVIERTITLPAEGFFENPITCILVIRPFNSKIYVCNVHKVRFL
nr:unnamed protein product [Callosobruchus analis]